MSLATRITDYYLDRAEQLNDQKRFHLASRLSAWTGEPRAHRLLAACRTFMVPEDASTANLTKILFSLVETKPTSESHIVAYEHRRPYFETYAPLYGLELALFRVRHWRTIYGIDAREALYTAYAEPRLRAMEKALYEDPAALRILSTYAINYLFLLRKVIIEDNQALQLSTFLHLAETYDLGNPEHRRLLVYLFTHCIIADTNFYTEELPRDHLPTYRQMLHVLEPMIDEHFVALSLDTKLEFLVCCRICDYDTPLAKRIYAECDQSLSPAGDFLIDSQNAFVTAPGKSTFEASEHRNVLFIMSTTPFIPHDLRVS